MATITRFLKNILIALIQTYRYCISFLLGNCCRFEPTCSSYAIQAIQQHGSLKGSYFSVRRLLRCHPWQIGGNDPIP